MSSSSAMKYFNLFPCEFWSLENYVSCIVYNNEYVNKDKAYFSFYATLREIIDDPTSSQRICNSAQKLLEEEKKKSDAKRANKMLSDITPRQILDDVEINTLKRPAESTSLSSTSPRKKMNNMPGKLSIKQMLCYILPSVLYPWDTSTSKSTTHLGGVTPSSVNCWGGFFDLVNGYVFDEEPKFDEQPNFIKNIPIRIEDGDYVAININIFMTLNALLGSDFVFSKQKPSDFDDGQPDATCRYRNKIIIPIEFKRQLVVMLKSGQLDYKNRTTKDVVDQIYSYMAELGLQYGIIST